MTDHIHKYRRVNIGQNGKLYYVMQCQLPSCSHYTPMATKLSAPMLMDKIAICNRCGDPFELNKRALRMAEPCCESCVKRKDVKTKSAEDFFAKLEESIRK